MNSMKEQCSACKALEEKLAPYALTTASGTKDIRVCEKCLIMLLVMEGPKVLQPIVIHGPKLAGVWCSDDFWRRSACNSQEPNLKEMFRAVTCVLSNKGKDINWLEVYLWIDNGNFRVVQNRIETTGGYFVMFKDYPAPAEIPAHDQASPEKCSSCGREMTKARGVFAGFGGAYLSQRPFFCKRCGKPVCGDCTNKLNRICPLCGGDILMQ